MGQVAYDAPEPDLTWHSCNRCRAGREHPFDGAGYLDVPTAPVDERDIAAVAVDALCKHAGAEYVLTGPQSLTQEEQLSTIGQAIGRHIDFEEISPETAQQELAGIMPGVVIDMLLAAWAAAKGQPAFVTDTGFQLTGAQPDRSPTGRRARPRIYPVSSE